MILKYRAINRAFLSVFRYKAACRLSNFSSKSSAIFKRDSLILRQIPSNINQTGDHLSTCSKDENSKSENEEASTSWIKNPVIFAGALIIFLYKVLENAECENINKTEKEKCNFLVFDHSQKCLG